MLVLLGFTCLSNTPVMMASVQESFPQNRALANGFYLNLCLDGDSNLGYTALPFGSDPEGTDPFFLL